ncbi:prepilin-type N-terminal cleavage/methylation domain-containing protein [Methylobacter sp. BBA5.1]|uniref:prepilin-type N-terminal cleavage/methylation domain-containing protein n=1 Tax=Methylobacter sp. BBA5.1 TaxID=1495064 RepID=UPI0009DE2119|nr:prepilin-type N-terminal cleavage/methylation domain-containing protein [Methylobacter sp. BBA5.1]
MNTSSLPQTRGFTLLEMTVVLLLMTLLASVAIRETNGLSFQVRYEQTRERLERIREAILGNPRQIINGQQAVSGFVADMGRLPKNLHELLEQNFCSDRTYSTQATCEAAGKIWNFQQDWTLDSDSGLWYGWHGPYLNISGSALDDDAFVDGWGSFAANSINHDYGWGLLLDTPETDGLTVLSYGKDQAPGGNCSDSDYSGDCSVQILKRDYQLDISPGITISVRGRPFSLNSHCSNASYTTRTDCEDNEGTWYGGCSDSEYANKSTCPAGKWNSCSITAHTTQADCEANQGLWYGDGYGCSSDPTKLDKATCPDPNEWYSCSDKSKTTQADCQATIPASNWFGDGPNSTRSICLSINYRSDEAIIHYPSASIIIEDGDLHTMVFSFPANTLINIGQASIGLYYQQDATGCKTTMPYPYPLDHKPLTVTVYPRTSLPAINW